MCFEVCNSYIADDVVVVIRGVLLTNLREVKQVALLGTLIAEVDTEGVVGEAPSRYASYTRSDSCRHTL